MTSANNKCTRGGSTLVSWSLGNPQKKEKKRKFRLPTKNVFESDTLHMKVMKVMNKYERDMRYNE